MAIQILLQGALTGAAGFMEAADGTPARAQWVSLLTEVLPRALIAELGLPPVVLGSSGGGQFLMVVPEDLRDRAGQFLSEAAGDLRKNSRGRLELHWAMTENLGAWSVVRKRLEDELRRKRGTPWAEGPRSLEPDGGTVPDFTGVGIVSWSPEKPGQVAPAAGKHTWRLGTEPDAVPLVRSASAADNTGIRGVLRADVDDFGVRLRRIESIEEHLRVSLMMKQFFAGELPLACSRPPYSGAIEILYSGGDDFAVQGPFEILIGFAREMQRLFSRFAEASLRELPGPEGKTISMGLALGLEEAEETGALFARAGEFLDRAKASGRDRIYLFGRALEWSQLAEAASLKEELARMVAERGVTHEDLRELARQKRAEKPWRFERRIGRVAGSARTRELRKTRNRIAAGLAGRSTGSSRLRPLGRVALEWARLATEEIE